MSRSNNRNPRSPPGRLDPTPVITNVFPMSEFTTGFEKMLERPRKSAKVILFPDKEEHQVAVKAMGKK